MKKVFCIGELLIDFICCNNESLSEGIYFEKKAGGAPAKCCGGNYKIRW